MGSHSRTQLMRLSSSSRSKIWGSLKEGETIFTRGSIRVKRFQWTKYSWLLNNGLFNCMGLLTHGFFSPNTYYSSRESHSWLNLWSQNQRFGGLIAELYADSPQNGGSVPLTHPSTPTHVGQLYIHFLSFTINILMSHPSILVLEGVLSVNNCMWKDELTISVIKICRKNQQGTSSFLSFSDEGRELPCFLLNHPWNSRPSTV